MNITYDSFKAREKAMEDEFFYRVDNKLLADLKAELATEAERRQLAAATGLGDEELLAELLAIGVSSEAIAAISLVPLVLVAWADGQVVPNERVPILRAAKEQGVAEESAAWKLLLHWLDTKPSPQLASTWKHYLEAATEGMSGATRRALRKEVTRRAQAVAKASRVPLNFKVLSTAEKRVVAEIDQVFENSTANL